MPHSISNVILHIVFSTKYRRKSIPEPVQPILHAYIAGICQSLDSFVYKVGGIDDHIHIACSLPRTMTIADLVQQIKQSSSKWIKNQDPLCRFFRWQNGYAVFSIGYRHIDYLVRYIGRQSQHHRKSEFKIELVDLLIKHNIDYDERYLWD